MWLSRGAELAIPALLPGMPEISGKRLPRVMEFAHARMFPFEAWYGDSSKDFLAWHVMLQDAWRKIGTFRDEFMVQVGQINPGRARDDVVKAFPLVMEALQDCHNIMFDIRTAALVRGFVPANVKSGLAQIFETESALGVDGNFRTAWNQAHVITTPELKQVNKPRRIDVHYMCCGGGAGDGGEAAVATLDVFLQRISQCELRAAVVLQNNQFETAANAMMDKIRTGQVGLNTINTRLNGLVDLLEVLWRECTQVARANIANRKRLELEVVEEFAGGGGGGGGGPRPFKRARVDAGGGGGDLIEIMDDSDEDVSQGLDAMFAVLDGAFVDGRVAVLEAQLDAQKRKLQSVVKIEKVG